MIPLAVDLYCGLGGWSEGLLAEGWDVVGFDIECHVYGDAHYPAQLVLQDVTTIHGSQFASVDLIVASPPCQAYSYRAMPWKRAKALPPPDNTLFETCFRIQREAIESSGRFIPLVVENVCGAQKWVGRAKWHFGSYYLWGDVPALMPPTSLAVKVPTMGAGWYPPDHPKHVAGLAFNTHAERHTKNTGGSWFNVAHNTTSGKGQNPTKRTAAGNGVRFTSRDCGIEGTKGVGLGSASRQRAEERHPNDPRNFYSKSNARKAASAHIAKIPLPLARWIARAWWPEDRREGTA